jgi:hypothetical protein
MRVPSASSASRPMDVVTQVIAVRSVGFSAPKVAPGLMISVSPAPTRSVRPSSVITSSPSRMCRISSRLTVCRGALVPAGISPRQAHSSLLPVRGVGVRDEAGAVDLVDDGVGRADDGHGCLQNGGGR